jgi:hypothetical protein
MMTLPMIYVNPITGVNAGRRNVCYVCEYGSAPVVAAFVRPEAIDEPGVLEAIQKLNDKHAALKAFVVCLSGPEDSVENKLLKLADEKKLTIPLTLLPDKRSETSIYQSLPIRPNARLTIMLYRGRQVVKVSEDLGFRGGSAAGAATVPQGSTLKSFSAFFVRGGGGSAAVPHLPESLDDSAAFKELDQAAAEMIAGY